MALRHYSLITKAMAKLRRSDMLKLLSHIPFGIKNDPAAVGETLRRHDNKVIACQKDKQFGLEASLGPSNELRNFASTLQRLNRERDS